MMLQTYRGRHQAENPITELITILIYKFDQGFTNALAIGYYYVANIITTVQQAILHNVVHSRSIA